MISLKPSVLGYAALGAVAVTRYAHSITEAFLFGTGWTIAGYLMTYKIRHGTAPDWFPTRGGTDE